MYCPFTKKDCVQTCDKWNVNSNLCNIQAAVDLYLFMSDSLIESIKDTVAVPDISNKIPNNPTCFLSGLSCQGANCVLWDKEPNSKKCSTTTAILNYQAYSMALINSIPVLNEETITKAQNKETPPETTTPPPTPPPAVPAAPEKPATTPEKPTATTPPTPPTTTPEKPA